MRIFSGTVNCTARFELIVFTIRKVFFPPLSFWTFLEVESPFLPPLSLSHGRLGEIPPSFSEFLVEGELFPRFQDVRYWEPKSRVFDSFLVENSSYVLCSRLRRSRLPTQFSWTVGAPRIDTFVRACAWQRFDKTRSCRRVTILQGWTIQVCKMYWK